MRKRLATAALALIVFQAYSQTHKAKSRENSQNPSTPVGSALQQRNSSTSVQPKPEEHIKADVWVVRSQPKDRYDKAAFWISVALAGIGIWGIVIAIWTVRTIKRQVDMFVSKERARITVDIEPFNPSDTNLYGILYDKSPNRADAFKISHVDLCVANSGETNAFIRNSLCKACIKQAGWDARKENIASQIGLPQVMYPHKEAFKHRARIETGHPLKPDVDRDTAQAIADGFLGIYVIGHIEFGDVFDNRWTVRFCRKWGAWMFGGQWQDTSSWYDYEPHTRGEFPMSGEFRIKRPSIIKRILRRVRKKKPEAPAIEIT